MIDSYKVLAVIPARGGSKGVPYKNIREVGGKPLIAWAIEAAKESKYIDRLILSSDDEKIMEKAIEWGCDVPFKRPDSLAKDDSRTVDAVIHALDQLEGYDIVVTLQATSPLLSACDIDACIKKMVRTGAKACISVTEPDKSPYWMFGLDDTGFMSPVMDVSYLNKRRQDLPPAYIPNGAVFVAFSDWLREHMTYYSDVTAGYVMPKDRSLDIDTEIDFMILEAIFRLRAQQNTNEQGS